MAADAQSPRADGAGGQTASIPTNFVGASTAHALFMVANVSTSRFAALSASASVVAERLDGLDDANARNCHARIMTIHPRLRAERLASADAMELLTAAKAAVRRDKAAVKSCIDAAIRVGELFNWRDISDFIHQEKATMLTMDGLAEALRSRGPVGQALSARFTRAWEESRAVAAELERATAEYARATSAFTAEYRALSAAIAFGRAVLADLSVDVPRIADAKRVSPRAVILDHRQVSARDEINAVAAVADSAIAVEVTRDTAEVEERTTPTATGLREAAAPAREPALRDDAFAIPALVDATHATVAQRNGVRRTAQQRQRHDCEQVLQYDFEHGADANHFRSRSLQRPTVHSQSAHDRASPSRHRRDISGSSGDSR
ncbi:MAG: hypothetical protein ACO1OB_20640 [Archangium sp.]